MQRIHFMNTSYRGSLKIQIDVLAVARSPQIISEISRRANLSHITTLKVIELSASSGLIKLLEGEDKIRAQEAAVRLQKGKIFQTTERGNLVVEKFAELSKFFEDRPFSLLRHTHSVDPILAVLQLCCERRKISELQNTELRSFQTAKLIEWLDRCGVVEKFEDVAQNDDPNNSPFFYKNTHKGMQALEKVAEFHKLLLLAPLSEADSALKKVGIRS
ncbi:MAG: hypothetical protein KGH53_00475 [Candidatus Micrarchaeota archaeon]|nr:hypothetical protein [Candidatus Micrarchaeota archaeon]